MSYVSCRKADKYEKDWNDEHRDSCASSDGLFRLNSLDSQNRGFLELFERGEWGSRRREHSGKERGKPERK
jgi:hypothetical protein